ncbi:UNVERIFIED_CONTAM: TRAP transporter substrate-binding protein [Kocuria sp. CPCC 205274]
MPPVRPSVPRLALLAAGALLLTGCAGAPGADGEGRTLVLSLNQTESHPSYVALTEFGDRLAERTDGRWDVEVYANETLGAQQEVIQLVGDGAVDMAVASGTQLENLNKEFQTLNLPTVFDDIEHQLAVINDDAIVGELFTSLEDDMDLTVLGGLTQGARNVYTAEGPVEQPEDLNGQKIRVQESDIHIDMIEAMGGSATPMAYGEVYTALQSGVLDGAENNEISYLSQKHNEVAEHMALTEHLIGLDYVVMNTGVLGGMSPGDRAVFDEEWVATSERHAELWTSETLEAVEAAKESGTVFTEVDEAAFDEALAPVVDKYLETDQARKLYDDVRKAAQR